MGIFIGRRYDVRRSIRPQRIIHGVGDVKCSRWLSKLGTSITSQHELSRDNEADDFKRLSNQHLIPRSKLANGTNAALICNKTHFEVRWKIS